MTSATDAAVAQGNELLIEQQPVKVLYKSWVSLATAIVTVRCPRAGALQVEVLDAGRLSAGKETDLQEVILSLVFDLGSTASNVQDYSKLNSVFSGITLRLRKDDNLVLLKLRANKNSYDSYATPLVKIRCTWRESSDTESPALETVVTDAIRIRSKIKALQNSQNALSRVPGFRQWMEDLEQHFRNGDVLQRLPTNALAVLEASAKGEGPHCPGLNPHPSNSAHTVALDALVSNDLHLAGGPSQLANLSSEQHVALMGYGAKAFPYVPNHVNLLQQLNQQQLVQPQPQPMPPTWSNNASLGSRKRQRDPGLAGLPATGTPPKLPFLGNSHNNVLSLQQPRVSSASVSQPQAAPMLGNLSAYSLPQMAGAPSALTAAPSVDQPFNGLVGTYLSHMPGNNFHFVAGPHLQSSGTAQIGPLTDCKQQNLALMSGMAAGSFSTLSQWPGAVVSMLHQQPKLGLSRESSGTAQHKQDVGVDYAIPSLAALQVLGGATPVKFPSKGFSLTQQPTPGLAFPLPQLPTQFAQVLPAAGGGMGLIASGAPADLVTTIQS